MCCLLAELSFCQELFNGLPWAQGKAHPVDNWLELRHSSIYGEDAAFLVQACIMFVLFFNIHISMISMSFHGPDCA